jgi:anti-sigma factor RsiW
MRCARVQDRLLVYLSGELSPPQAAGVAHHLEHCAACAALAETLAETAEQVDGSLATTIEPPASLDQQVMETIRRLPAPRRPWFAVLHHEGWPQRLAVAGAALCLLIAVFFAGSWNATRNRTVAVAPVPVLDLARLGEAHRELLAAPASAEIKVSAPQELAHTLAPLVPFTVGVVDLRSEGLRLVGGSQSSVNGIRVAILHYEWEGERVSLFQMDGRELAPASLRQVVVGSDSYFVKKADGLTYVAWSLGRTNCVIVTHAMPMHILFRFACHVSERLERV